ncbi:hypothetical protein [Cognatilysobacter bugurensis]|uniref:DUF3304 domain-containing protein n=1 Tax=Cognatilysobacter bugurensis TaxID=543356 RepID=A0A918WA47_9GAMM|nr:hypothetical protein [Lysobacter bugurensis]GHA82171.1 hypothetical protein GCM10007067_20130 [Lysobacter bugurensis]
MILIDFTDWKWAIRALAVAGVLWASVGCSREPKQKSLTAIAYNYGEQAFGHVLVNGKWAGPVLSEVEPGGVTGGGSICCVKIEKGAKTARVTIQYIDGDYIVDAPIEQPWPPDGYGHYLAIHVLPGRTVQLSISSSLPFPRMDLLKSQLNALGIQNYVIENPHMWDLGPETNVDYSEISR